MCRSISKRAERICVSWDARNLPLKRLINVFAFLIYIWDSYVGRILLIPPVICSSQLN